MTSTLKSERIHISFFGRTNVGKSSIINFIADQDIAIVSSMHGTTTDCIEKTMELQPIGPVVLIDTAGIDDDTTLAEERQKKTNAVFDKSDFACLVVEPNIWTNYESDIIEKFRSLNINYAILINKVDLSQPTSTFNLLLRSTTKNIISLNTTTTDRSKFLSELTTVINKELPISKNTNMFEDLIKAKDMVLFVTPIDAGTPKGRMILPQVQALRAVLDKGGVASFVQLAEYREAISMMTTSPKLVVTDSQVIKEVIELSAETQPITTFSILLSRLKGNFELEVEGVYAIETIKPKDIILIAEACSHHAQKDDIARVKLPQVLEKFIGFMPIIEYTNGKDFPENLEQYRCIIHCGACMLTHKEKLNRINKAKQQNIPITNFGMTLAFCNGYLRRAIAVF